MTTNPPILLYKVTCIRELLDIGMSNIMKILLKRWVICSSVGNMKVTFGKYSLRKVFPQLFFRIETNFDKRVVVSIPHITHIPGML